MIKRILPALGIALLVFIAVVLFDTFSEKPWSIKTATAVQEPLPDSAIQHLSQAVQIPTISYSDTSAIDTAAFTAFCSFIERSYPLVHHRLSRTYINRFNLVFEWRGQIPQLAPIILMGHYDVVPVETATLDKWTVAPFSGAITDSCIWGRGSVDDKCGVISILEATETLLRKGFVPKRTIYLCFGHDEEISGKSAGLTAAYLKQKKVQAEMVLDEGGEITEDKIKDVKRPVAVIGIAEKGYVSFELSVEKEGGHSMMPAKETAIDILVAALVKLRSKTMPARITPPVSEFLKRVGSSSTNFMNRMAAGNMWLLEGQVKKIISSTPEGSAMIRTTIVPTILASGVKDNVIPGTARAIVNSRILPGETIQTVEEYIRETIQDDRVRITITGKYNSDPSAETSIESPAFKRIENAVCENISHVLATPYLVTGATDSRYYRGISDGVVNFLPMTDSKGFHAVNERLPIRDLQRCIKFMMTVIEETNREFKR